MPVDIFNLFKNSIEKVHVTNTPRGTLSASTPTVDVYLDAIVKRRNSMASAVNNSEDKQSNTTIHFKITDYNYIKVGYYVEIDGEYHSIISAKPGLDFRTGVGNFIYATLGNDILSNETDVVWSDGASA